VIAGLLGLLVLFNPTTFDWTSRAIVLGNAAILVAAVLWAISILHIRAHAWRSTPMDLVPWAMLLATVIITSLALRVDGWIDVKWNTRLVLLLLYAGIPGTGLAYWASATASRMLPAVTTALGLLATPVVSVVVATLWLREPLTLSLLGAIVLILGGIALGTTGGTPGPASRKSA
jgi:drug/metabolite transporter (DMT)-like permease